MFSFKDYFPLYYSSLEAEMHTYKTQIMQLERQLSEVNGKLNSTSTRLDMSNDMTALNEETLAAVTTERDSLLTECHTLRSQNQKLIAEQVINFFILHFNSAVLLSVDVCL